MGVLIGSTIFNYRATEKSHDAVTKGLNNGELDGLIMTDRVGAYRHNLTAANVMIFFGSLYSKPYKEQAMGMFSLKNGD